MKEEKTFTVRINDVKMIARDVEIKFGDYTTVSHEIEVEGLPSPCVKAIMDEMTADLHRAMFIGMDLGTGGMTTTTVAINESALTIADLERAMNMMLLNSPPLPKAPEVKAKDEPKSEFKSWPYGID